jgi:DNA-binding response OmpR family regulator
MHTVLIVDDEPIFLDILQLILRRAGYSTLTAADGLDALRAIQTYRPDLVLLDDMLPGMNGGEVCVKVKSDPNLAGTRVILYSAGTRVRDSSFLDSIGADGVLFKPFKPDEVLKVVERSLQAYA